MQANIKDCGINKPICSYQLTTDELAVLRLMSCNYTKEEMLVELSISGDVLSSRYHSLYENASMNMIASEVSIKSASLYRHHIGKEAIIDNIYKYFEDHFLITENPMKRLPIY